MSTITEPLKFTVPFAETGLKNAIPATANNTTGKAGFDKGFPERTMLPKASGGIPPSGMDFNGILFDVTAAIRYMQAGGKPTFDAGFAAAIGGYPSGAVLIGDDGVSVFQNAVAGNETDPNSGGAGWTRPDLQVMEMYRRSYAEAGYNVVGTFQAGFTYVNANDVGIDLATGKGFTGPAGTVAAGTDPITGGFVDQSANLLRGQLGADAGNLIRMKMPSSTFTETLNEYLSHQIFNIADYGASPSKTGAENHLIMSAVEGFAKAVGGRVLVPAGVFKRAGNTVMDSRFALCGVLNAVQNHGDTQGSIIKYEGNYGTTVSLSSKVLIEDIAFQQVGGTDAKGIDLIQAGRSTLSRVTVDGFAGDGIVAVNGNLSSYTDIICLNNGGDGFKLAGLPTPDINCASIRNIDSRGNAGVGINLDAAWNVMGFGLVAQSNGGYGVVVNNCRQSFLIIYSENNTAGSIHYTNHPNNEGNFIIESFVDVASVDDSKGENTVLKSKAGADTWSMFEGLTCKSLLIPNASALGALRLKHDTAARHDFYAEKTGQSQTLRWKNVAGIANIDADTPVYPFIHHFIGAAVQRDRLVFTNGDTAPNVSLSEFWLANNSAATTISSFAGGVPGQKIMVVFNNGNTTIQHSSTNTGVRLKGGVTKTFSQYEGATFVKNGANWWIEV